MLKKYLNKKLTNKDKKEIIQATKNFKKSLLCGAIYSATLYAINQIAGNEKPTEISTLILDSINSGFDLSAFNYVSTVSAILFKPDILKTYQLLRFQLETSILTTALMQSIKTPIRNYYVTGKISMNQYFERFIPSAISDSASHICLTLAYLHLPPSSQMGGEFARSLAIMTLGNFGGYFALSSTLGGKDMTFKKILVNYWNRIPFNLMDHSIFYVIQHYFDKFSYNKYLRI